MPGEAVSVLEPGASFVSTLSSTACCTWSTMCGLVVSELAGNAVRHAQSPFTVSLRQADRAVFLSVQDGSSCAPALLAPEVLDTAGRGLSIVDLVSEDSGVTPAPGGGKSVWASFSTR